MLNRKQKVRMIISLAVSMMIVLPLCAQVFDGKRHIPVPTSEGTFMGTWFYVDRDMRFAIYFREEEGKIQAKLRWEIYHSEMFETDWDGKCTYMYEGNEGNVHLDIANPENKDQLEGKWSWRLGSGTGERIEEGTFTIYRSEKGLKLAWIMPDWSQRFKSGEKEKKYKYEQMHILRKASNRLIQWDEIPFS